MHYFLDSNVLIADIFSLDPLHEYSIDVFLGDGIYYFSENVKKECEKVFKRKLKEYTDFFSQLQFYFESNTKTFVSQGIDENLVDVSVLHSLVKFITVSTRFSNENMHNAINVFLKECNLDYYENINHINSILTDFLHELKSNSYKSKQELISRLSKVPLHNKSYSEIEDFALKNNLKLHDKDKFILLDAHEFACKHKNISLIFISADYDFHISIKSLMDLLCIKESIYLKNFN